MRAPQQPDNIIKILLIGDSAVGKSCLLLRYTDNRFSGNFLMTIGVDFKTKFIQIDGRKVKLQIWDTAGQEKYHSVTKAYYRGAHGILVVFDLSKRDTFQQVKRWIDSILDSSSKTIDIVLVGNKTDLSRAVQKDEAENLANEYDIPYFETSAKLGQGIDAPFDFLSTSVLKRQMNTHQNNPDFFHSLPNPKCSC
jgi:small GTP-binding protein